MRLHAGVSLVVFATVSIFGSLAKCSGQATPFQFNAGILSPSGTLQPSLVTPGDFNNDGKLDVITLQQDSVAVYLGNGDGTFQAAISTTVPSPARAIAVGDFNGDGKLDVAVESDYPGNSGTLTVLLGNGDGTFTQSASYPVNGVNGSLDVPTMAAGDFNGDSKLDLVSTLACYDIADNGCSVGAVLVYPGNGDGTFGTPQTYPTIGNGALPVTVANLNGKTDIVAVNPFAPGDNSHNSLTVLLNNGDGSFSQSIVPVSFYGATNVVAADFNGDGNMDLAASGYYSQTQVLFGNGDGTFQAAVQYSTSANMGLAVADFNGDGKPDLVVGAGGSGPQNLAALLINDGTGNFQVSAYPLGGWAQGADAVGDFNGDGKIDVIVASVCSEEGVPSTSAIDHCPDGALGLLLGNGDGTMQAATILPAPSGVEEPNAELTADLNGDGIPDLIQIGWGNGGPGLVTVFLGMGGGAFEPPTTVPTGAIEPYAAIVGDFNHDGKIDLAVAHRCLDDSCSDGAVAVLLGKGDGTFQQPVIYPTPATNGNPPWIAGGDVNGDGKTDLIVTNYCFDSNCMTGSVSVLLGVGDGTFNTAVTTDTPGMWNSAVATGDLNHDGKDEIVVVGRYSTVDSSGDFPVVESVYSVNPDASLSQIGSTYGAGGYQGVSVALKDINNDGNLDIVVTTLCAHVVCNDATPPDYDPGDGGGGVAILLGNGDGTFNYGRSYDIPDANFLSAAIGDVSGDGKPDLVASTLTGIAVLNGNGDGTFGPATVYAGNSQVMAEQIVVADLNGDGSLDVATPGSYDGTTALFFNHTGLTGGATPPASLTARAASPVEIDLAWTESSVNVTQFDIENSSDGVNFSPLATVGKGTTTFPVTGLSPGSQFAYRVRAESSEGYTLYSNIASATTPLLYTTSTTLAASPNPVAAGQNVTLTAMVTGGNAPTGSVNFMDGATLLGGAGLIGNQATFLTSSLVAGTHSLSATYGGDSANAGSTGTFSLTVTSSNGSCTTANPNPNPNPESFAAPGDFNGDCKSDILWRNTSTEQVYEWLMNGTTYSGSGSPGTPTSDWVIQGTGDFNGDGYADILWRNSTTGEVYIWLMNGTTFNNSGSLGYVSSDWTIQGVGDFNGDGKADILWRNTTTGQVYLWLINGTTMSGGGSVTYITSDWVIQSIGDFNGDGMADILWRNTTTGEVYIWLMNSNTLTTSGSLGYVSSDWSIAGVGDFNGDGKSDILWRNSTTGQVYLWLINGTAMSGGGSVTYVSSDWLIQGLGDYDGSGRAGILWRNTTTEQVYIWLMNGTTLTSSGSPGAPNNTWQIAP